MTKRILVVEDQEDNRQILRDLLGSVDVEMIEAHDGEAAVAQAKKHKPDLILMDIQLPIMDGYEATRRIKADPALKAIPIIVVTSYALSGDDAKARAAGADDYVTKPFSPRELVLRVDSILRRSGERGQPDDVVLCDGDLVLDSAQHVVSRSGARLALTSREFDLLRFFLANEGVAFTRAELLEKVWGWSFGDHSTVTVHVRRLREKIEADPTRPTRLTTVWGVGYRWETP
jgi:DNA-binding response OmpR family regulator